MADLRAFRGFRYDLGRVGSLADVICPPYDVIDPALQQKLYDRSPFNAIRIELTQDQPGDGETENKYTRAARTLNEWQHEGVLKQDSARSLYAYEQEFTVEGQTFTRRGFLARVRLEPFGTGRIFPHEQTIAAHKADRLKLYNATGFNISPVFGLYPDEAGEVFGRIEPLIRNAPPITATDHLGVVNRFWPIADSHLISQLIGAMGPKPVFIADGHHRYETGLKYLEEQKAAGRVADDEAPANFCLMMLVGMSDPGLRILPTHRLVNGLPEIDTDTLEAVLEEHFEILADFDSAAACWEHVQLEDSQSVLGLGTVSDGTWLAVKLKDPAVMQTLAPEQSPEWRALAVSILHKLVLDKLVKEKLGGEAKCTYVHLLKEVTDSVEAGGCQLACLVPPCSMRDVEEIAGHREKMPPKSTYFYPKILTGMVLHSLKKD
jgi:uncharacterized protein (DUF1015 family)